ncbi:MAG: response regulator transcription factor [Lysobacterales bacterium]
MQPRPKIRILLVDDHPVVRSGIAAVLADESDLEVVGEGASAAQARSLFARFTPDVSLLDVMLPDGNGIDLVGELHAISPNARFVILTARTCAGDLDRALAAGAHGYLFKNAPCSELLTAIRIASMGGRYVSPAVGRETDHAPHGAHLTSREVEVIRRITRGHSNHQIAQDLGVTDETVKSHTKNILLKLGVQSRGQAAAQCLKLGLMHADEL